MYKILIVVKHSFGDGTGVTTQVVDFPTKDQAERAIQSISDHQARNHYVSNQYAVALF